MASAPDRINIKRRREDEVVDVLTLTSSKKQRTSDQYFIRLEYEDPARTKERISKDPTASSNISQVSAALSGIPVVGSTLPGDEIKDFQKYKAARLTPQKTPLEASGTSGTRNGLGQSHSVHKLPPSHARRFHLTRDLSSVLRPQHPNGIRKSKSYLRPHLPTFIEKLKSFDVEDISAHAEPPIDRIIKSVDGTDHKLDLQRILSDNGSIKRERTATFQKPKTLLARTGQSIKDDPATWDLTSDKLANELMTLALEMDPDAKKVYESDLANHKDPVLQSRQLKPTFVDEPEDYVYETYVRVQQKGFSGLESLTQSSNVGYLIIDEDEEELWEQYLLDDEEDDDEWDEEDGDSNAEDHPRNDYPEDEISSDDEYGRSIYRYRKDHSDDERLDQYYA